MVQQHTQIEGDRSNFRKRTDCIHIELSQMWLPSKLSFEVYLHADLTHSFPLKKCSVQPKQVYVTNGKDERLGTT